jgi:hypothetical protein
MAALTTFVHVDGTWYGPGRNVPDDVAAKITNPRVWADGHIPTVPDSDAEDRVRAGATTDPIQAAQPEVGDRPRGNASREEWASYAARLSVAVSDDMTRDAIVAAVDTHQKD